eukprot:SAG31_NODE_16565_length_704_cov_0.745455_2_plen_88_part_01
MAPLADAAAHEKNEGIQSVACIMPPHVLLRRSLGSDGGRRGALSAPDRERPHLIMGKAGFTPVAISTGFRDGPGDHTYTLAQETDLSK